MKSVVTPELPNVGYRGPATPQLSIEEVLGMYDPSPKTVPAGMASTSSTVPASTSEPARSRAYYPPSEDVCGSLTTRDANRIWEVATDMAKEQYRDRQLVPPSNVDQAQIRKSSIIADKSNTVRAHVVDIGKHAWEQYVRARLVQAHDNYFALHSTT